MAPHNGLMQGKVYDFKDSNIELIGTAIDHRVKHQSADTEPAWNNGIIGKEAGLYIWRIEDFQVVPWPQKFAGQFYEGDSYIILHSYKLGKNRDDLGHAIFFWLGSKTSQDEAGVAAYKTVELDEFLSGTAIQHRELQSSPSEEFLSLFPKLKILSGGVATGFKHVDENEKPEHVTLLRIFKHGTGILVHEVEPTWESLDDEDVFVLDQKGEKIFVWQGRKSSPMEKARAALIVGDMTLAKHIDVEVLSQSEARSRVVVDLLGGPSGQAHNEKYGSRRPIRRLSIDATKKLFRLSDASGELKFECVKEGAEVSHHDLDTNDVFLLDAGKIVWVWKGKQASDGEKRSWLNVCQRYIGGLQDRQATPIATVSEGNEGTGFFRALEVV